MSFVRQSKFRHVFGRAFKSTECFNNISAKGNGDTNLAVSSKFLALIKDSKIFILDLGETGRIEENNKPFIDCPNKPLDVAWSPFNPCVLAAGDEDGDVKVYLIPEDGLKENMRDPFWDLVDKHRKKVTFLQWHPSAENILASGGADNWIVLWNTERQSPINIFEFTDSPGGLSWNFDGSLFATAYPQDKKTCLCIVDPRKNEIIAENGDAHPGSKLARCVFLKNGNIITIGSDKHANRYMKMWKKGCFTECLFELDLGSSSAVLNTYYDSDLNILYTYVKGESVVRYYEIDETQIHFLSTYQATNSQRGGNFMPKRCMNTKENEIARFYKLDDKKCEPVSFTVPRKSDHFQDDIYPPCAAGEPALTADEWLEGKNAEPCTVAFKPGESDGKQRETKKLMKPMTKSLPQQTSKPSSYQPPSYKTEPVAAAAPQNSTNHTSVPEGVDLREMFEDMKKVKATVRKLNKRVAKLEEQLEQVNAVVQDEEEEEEEEE